MPWPSWPGCWASLSSNSDFFFFFLTFFFKAVRAALYTERRGLLFGIFGKIPPVFFLLFLAPDGATEKEDELYHSAIASWYNKNKQ